MQVCSNCGKSIKYIATGYDTVIVCEASEVKIISITGHTFSGFMPHKCENQESKECQKTQTN